MPAKLSIKMLGDRQLAKAFDELPRKLQGKILRPAIRKGCKVVAETAKSLAPQDEGEMAKSIKVRALKAKRGSINIGVLTQSSDFKGDFHSAFVELGYHKGETYVPPQPFLRPALQQNEQRVITEVAQAVRAKLPSEAKPNG